MCLFCDIVAGKIPNYTVAENDHALAFLDIEPLAEGHTLVIPKIHAENIIDLSEEYISGVFSLVQEVTKKVEQALSPEGFTIGINMRKGGRQAVDHLHVHIIPRWMSDEGGSIHTIVHNPPEELVEETLKKIKS